LGTNDKFRNGITIIMGHLGLGDAIVTNGLVRVRARLHRALLIPCKPHNLESVRWMFSDLKNVFVLPVDGDDGMRRLVEVSGLNTLKLGLFSDGQWDIQHWDREMYRQAEVSFSDRWDEFSFPKRPEPLPVPTGDYSFVHDDPSRGFYIADSKMPVMKKEPRMHWGGSANIFDYIPMIENATEIHVIDSAFFCLVDSLRGLKARRLVLHLYARPKALPPAYRQNWEVLR